MASYYVFFFFFFFLSLLSICPFNFSLTIPLSHFHTNPSSQDPYLKFNALVSSSLSRAFHLKNPKTTRTTATSLSSHSYGGYSISLSFGTPPQTIPFVMDTGSQLVWFPCTTHYLCRNCSFSSSNNHHHHPPPKIPFFIPKKSSSSKIVGCHNPKCAWIHDHNLKCRDTQICPPYLVLYGSGNTGGIALSETLNLPNKTIPDFLVGCSVTSYRQPAGIAGFGRGDTSLPSQLNLNKFSFCLLSHKLDDTRRSSSLVLDTGSHSAKKTSRLIYTPFINNPRVPGRSEFSVYYYLGLRRITVGGQHVKILSKYLSPENDGNGGTIIDSGTTFTFMTRDVVEPLVDELVAQVKNYSTRAVAAEVKTGLSLCFNISGAKTITFPELRLHFKGGSDMVIPLENYLVAVDDDSIKCLAVVTDGVDGGEATRGGPAIILGNFQMQNYYVEYDLRNQRLGFKKQQCR
ncbi:hypothetical protein ACOSQ4_016115 [Xanthoceras sorbifolium]